MQMLITAKGIRIPIVHEGIAFTRDYYIFVPMEGNTKRNLLEIFDDPEQTVEMTIYKDSNVVSDETTKVVKGYTQNIAIMENPEINQFSIGMRRPFEE